MNSRFVLALIAFAGLASCSTDPSTVAKPRTMAEVTGFRGLSQPLNPILCTPTEFSSQSRDISLIPYSMTRTLRIRSIDSNTIEIATLAPNDRARLQTAQITQANDSMLFAIYSSERTPSGKHTMMGFHVDLKSRNGTRFARQQLVQNDSNGSHQNEWLFSCTDED